MAQFTFRQGPVMPEQTWTCAEHRLERDGGPALDLRSVTGGRFLYTPSPKLAVAQFGLDTPAASIDLQCNARIGSDSHQAFGAMLDTVLASLAQSNPGVTFTPPPNENRIRRVGQFFGVLGLLYGIYFALVNGVLESSGLGVGFGVFIIAMASFWIWATAPISTDPQSIEATREWVAASYGPKR